MTGEIDPNGELLDLIYDAAADPNLWNSALVKIADATAGVGCHIFGADSKPGTDNRERMLTFAFLGNFNEDVFRTYGERHLINPFSVTMDSVPASSIIQSDAIIPLRELQRTPLFDEILQPLDVSHCTMVSVVATDNFRVGFVAARNARQGPHDERALRFLASLYPHVRRSLGLGFRLEGYKELQQHQFDALDRLSTGVILLDRRSRLLYANAAALSNASDDGPLRLRNSGITLHPLASSRQLATLIRKAQLGSPIAAMSVPHNDGRLATLIVSSVRGNDLGRLTDAHLPDAGVLLFVIDPSHRQGIPLSSLTDLYGLTQAEAKVALAIASGRSVPDAASVLGLSSNTMKTHLRRVFEKTGTHRQADLSRLLASIGLRDPTETGDVRPHRHVDSPLPTVPGDE